MNRFVVLAAPRTGSNLLCTLLNSHPEILCHHEVFNPQGVFLALSHRDSSNSLGECEHRDREPLAFLEEVWKTGYHYRCVGFKWTRRQEEQVLRHVCQQDAIAKIVLRRKNRIKTFVSEKIAQITNQWEVYEKDELVFPRPRVIVQHDELLEHVKENEQFYSRLISTLANSSQPFVTAYYETLFDRKQQAQLLKFLGVDECDVTLRAASVKQNSSNLRQSIVNFAELEANLQGSDLLADLHDCDS